MHWFSPCYFPSFIISPSLFKIASHLVRNFGIYSVSIRRAPGLNILFWMSRKITDQTMKSLRFFLNTHPRIGLNFHQGTIKYSQNCKTIFVHANRFSEKKYPLRGKKSCDIFNYFSINKADTYGFMQRILIGALFNVYRLNFCLLLVVWD